MSEQPAYDDDDKVVSILKVLRDAGLFYEVIQPKTTFDGESIEDFDPYDPDDLDKVLDKSELDPETYTFSESYKDFDGEYSVVRAGVINARTDKQPSGHDWVSSATNIGMKLHTNMTGYSMCGKPLSECYDFNCVHKTVGFDHIWKVDERNEFLEPSTSLADRPTESFWIGLPGLRLTENQETLDARWFRWNKVCQECHILTPINFDTCQNCDKVLVA